MRSKRRKQKGVGEWMVAQMVIPVFISPFTTLITCAQLPRIREAVNAFQPISIACHAIPRSGLICAEICCVTIKQ